MKYCRAITDVLYSIREFGTYTGSPNNHSNACYCNTVFYSTMAACGYCQVAVNPNAIQTYVFCRFEWPPYTHLTPRLDGQILSQSVRWQISLYNGVSCPTLDLVVHISLVHLAYFRYPGETPDGTQIPDWAYAFDGSVSASLFAICTLN